jgi:hypothetical protein
LNEQLYSPLIFMYQTLNLFKKWIIVDFQHASYEKNKIYTYNFYDIFKQNDNLIDEYSQTKFWHSHNDLIEYFMINYIILIFLIRIFHAYSQKSIKQNALQEVKTWLDKNFPNWRNNKILNNPKNRQPELSIAFVKFKFKTNYVNKIIRKYKL